MPTYDYKCECGNKKEVFFRSIREMEESEKSGKEKQDNPIICPCGKQMTKDYATPFNFELKGLDFPSKRNKRPLG